MSNPAFHWVWGQVNSIWLYVLRKNFYFPDLNIILNYQQSVEPLKVLFNFLARITRISLSFIVLSFHFKEDLNLSITSRKVHTSGTWVNKVANTQTCGLFFLWWKVFVLKNIQVRSSKVFLSFIFEAKAKAESEAKPKKCISSFVWESTLPYMVRVGGYHSCGIACGKMTSRVFYFSNFLLGSLASELCFFCWNLNVLTCS